MFHACHIPKSLIMYDSHPYSCGWWLLDPVTKWLRANVGGGHPWPSEMFTGNGQTDSSLAPQHYWYWLDDLDVNPDFNKGGTLYFRDLNAALLFKLIWG